MWLFLGLLLFGGSHAFSILAPGARDNLKVKLGEKPYKLAYSLASLAGLAFLAKAYIDGRGLDLLYQPWDSGRHLIMLLVLIGFVLIFSNQSRGYISTWVQQPFSIGVAIWAIAHLLANGERVVVYIFGMFLILSLLDIIFSSARGKRPMHIPNPMHDLRSIAVGLVLYLVFLFGFHPYVLGIPVI